MTDQMTEVGELNRRLAEATGNAMEAGSQLALARERVARLERDIRIMADRFHTEAVERDWCSDYDAICEDVNSQLSQPWLILCGGEYEETYVVTVSFSCPRNRADDVREEIYAGLDGIGEAVDTPCDEFSVSVQHR